MSTNPPTVPSPKSMESASSPSGAGQSPTRPLTISGSTGSHSFPWGTVVGWLLLIGLSYGAWHYHERWLPWVETQLGRNKPAATKPPRIVPVSTAVVRQRDMPIYLNGLGTVTAFKTVTIRSRVEGGLNKIAFTEGQMVDEGDLLAEIDPRPFEVQLEQAESLLARDQAILKTAKLTLSRYEGLVASKSIAAQQLDDQATIVQQTMAAIQTDEAMIANAKLQLTYSRIVAPISGRIGLRLVDQGNIVRANDPTGLAVITQLQPIALIFTIPQDDIGRVQRRSLIDDKLQVVAFDREFKLKLATGQLLAIDNQVDATTGTVRLKAQFENKDGMLFPNQFVNARLLVDTKSNAIVVPSAAIQRGPTSMFVYVVKADDTVELRNVVPGPAEGAETAIESGLEPGEIVVTDGLDKLQPGAKIVSREKTAAGKKGETDKNGDSKNPSPKVDPEKEGPKSKAVPSSSDTGPPRATADQGPGKKPQEPGPTPAFDVKPKGSSCDESDSQGKDTP